MTPSILFVDDNLNILSGLRRTMRSHADAWQMDFVSSGEEALEILEKQPVNLLVTDMRMPGMDGAQLLERVSQSAPGVFRFALSGETDIAQAIRIVGKSHRFLAKPIEPEILATTISDLFGADSAFLNAHCEQNGSTFDCLKCAKGRLEVLGTLVSAPDKNHARIAAQVMSDPSLSIRMLQLCNSAYFGKPLRTISIPKAVAYVGVSRIAKLLEKTRLGGEMTADPGDSNDHVLRTMAAVIAREQVTAAGLGDEMQDLAFATALFSGLGRASLEVPDCSTKPACIAALFGLPDPLVISLRLFCELQEQPISEDEIAARAVETSRNAIDRVREAA